MKNLEKPGELNTILGKGAYFEGVITVEHSLRVDGKVKGDVKTSDTLVVGKDGEIEGNVKAKNLVVGGKLNGIVDADGKTVLESRSEFHGEMKTRKLVIDEGAIFDGKCSMLGDDKKMTDITKKNDDIKNLEPTFKVQSR
ncbi:MAG TPA: polymer-forming cytoskeletal protein [bacterium]|nr:polymer-forming cytoskeletal protein [bacterium]HPN42654.1 polymer-forming cytoskeletal protein [bacterium]